MLVYEKTAIYLHRMPSHIEKAAILFIRVRWSRVTFCAVTRSILRGKDTQCKTEESA